MIDIDQFERITLEEWWDNVMRSDDEHIHPKAHIYAHGYGGPEFKFQYLKHNHPSKQPTLEHMESTLKGLNMEWDDTVGRLFRLSRKIGFRFIPLVGWGLAAKDVYDLITD